MKKGQQKSKVLIVNASSLEESDGKQTLMNTINSQHSDGL